MKGFERVHVELSPFLSVCIYTVDHASGFTFMAAKACKAHFNMLIENALYKFITITIIITITITPTGIS